MKTIFSDGKTLEIEKKLRITVFLPQLCHFCGEEITKFGVKSGSLCFHSLDDNHDNWEPSNKVPAHRGCHQSFHQKGVPKSPEMRAKLMGDKNPMRRPEVAQRATASRLERDPEHRWAQETWKTRRARYGPSGKKPGAKPNDNKKAWETRRRLYGPTGRKLKGADQLNHNRNEVM